MLCMGVIVASLLCFDLQQEATAESSSKEQGVKRALLIGINKYQIAGADLRGCVNDVKGLSAALVEFHGFKTGDIAVLTDGAATKKAMQAGIKNLVREAKKGDVVLLHYSGHGSNVPDDKDRKSVV